MAAQPPGQPLIQPTAPTLGPPQHPQMTLQPTGQARQLFAAQPPAAAGRQPLVQPLAPAGFAPAAQPPLDAGYEDREARRRVVCISLAIAVYVVLGTFLQYYFDIAALQDAMDKIRAVTKMPGRHVDIFSLMLRTSAQVGWSIAVGLLVPLCGYLGVKQNNTGLMGCFSCCNALHCCCGVFSMATLATVLFGTSVAAPGILEYLDGCDPMFCAPRGLNHTATNHVVDCLAASTWEDYEPRFHGTPRLPPTCPKFFLDCKSFQAALHDGPDGPQYFKPEAEDEPLTRRLSVFRKPLMATHDSAFRRQAIIGRRNEWQPTVPPKPKDPLAECEPAETVKMFHQARILAPELLPKVLLFFTVKLVLMIPFVVLGCFGFCWGKDMWSRLNQGYSHLSAPVPAQSEIALQPVMGFAMAPPVADAQLAQPLMLSAPPQPAALQQQQAVTLHGQAVQAVASPPTTDQE